METIIVAAIGALSTIIVSVISVRANRKCKVDSRTKAIENGLCSLLRAEIIRNHDKYTDKGYCPIYAKEALKNTYSAYHALGGNDVATSLYHEVMGLKEKPINVKGE